MKHTIPVITGVGQITDKAVSFNTALDPLQLLCEAVLKCFEDAGLSRDTVGSLIDTTVVTSGFVDYLENPPQALCDELGISSRQLYLSGTGGSSPQAAVNHLSARIADNKIQCALLAGMEAQATLSMARKAGIKPDWHYPSAVPPALLFPFRAGDGGCETEHAHGITLPINVYPMFENALRHHYGRTVAAHQKKIAALFSGFTRVARDNPYAWFQQSLSPEEIMTVTPDNRYVGFPYTKRMNAMLGVNQAAAVLLMSDALADRLAVAKEKRVYLHGCADARDHWYVLNRVNYHTSPAIRLCGETASAMAGRSVDDMAFFDLYSCFPCAVQISRDMLGIDEDDHRPLTVTGGLPYFGGPGNNYVMHAISAMVERLRSAPGSFGMVTGNSFYLSKHSIGIYSTEPIRRPWHRTPPETLQKQIDAMEEPQIEPQPNGSAIVETYTVVYGRDGRPVRGIVIGRTLDGKGLGGRFAAHTPRDAGLWKEMTTRDWVGTTGRVRQNGVLNIFEPE